jgi:hypothetical protein
MSSPCPWIRGIRPRLPSTRLIVCGSRHLEDYDLVERKLNKITYFFDMIEVVLGGEGKRIEREGEWVWTGADHLGKLWAEKQWWDRNFFGGYKEEIIAKKMSEYVSPNGYCVCFGKSNITKEFLKCNPRKNLRIIKFC